MTIKEFSTAFMNIELVNRFANINGIAESFYSPSYSIDANVFSVRNKFKRGSLPRWDWS